MEIILQTLSILFGLGATMYVMLRFMLKDMHRDMMRLEQDMNKNITRIEDEQKQARIRTDHLYEMLCNIMNEKKRA